MASDLPRAPLSLADEASKKKTRPNPARRKASKAKFQANESGSQTPTVGNGKPRGLGTPRPAPPPRSTTEPATQARPAVFRQRSEPLTKAITLPPKTQSKDVTKTQPTTPAGHPTFTDSRQKVNNQLTLRDPALTTGGLIGSAASAAVLLGVHLWYNFAGPEQAILVAKSARLCVDNMTDEIITSQKAGTYSADEALDVLRRTTQSYASTIPGGAPMVERIFQEVNMVRRQRGQEIDDIVSETYEKLTKAAARKANAAETQNIVLSQLIKLSGFASRSIQDVVTRNPRLKQYRDGAIKSLQGPSDLKVPTMRVNMTVKQKVPDKAR